MQPKISSRGTVLTSDVHHGSALLLKIACQAHRMWKLLSDEREKLRAQPFSLLSSTEARRIRDGLFSTHRNKNFIQKLLPDTKEPGEVKPRWWINTPLSCCDLHCLLPSFSASKLWDDGVIDVIKAPQTLQMKTSSCCPHVFLLTVSVL